MPALIKALCDMSGIFSGLAMKEKDPINRRVLFELLEMINDKLMISLRYKNLKIEKHNLNEVISRIKDTEKLVKGFKQKAKTYGDLLDHVIKVCNEVEGLFLLITWKSLQKKPTFSSLPGFKSLPMQVLNGLGLPAPFLDWTLMVRSTKNSHPINQNKEKIK